MCEGIGVRTEMVLVDLPQAVAADAVVGGGTGGLVVSDADLGKQG